MMHQSKSLQRERQGPKPRPLSPHLSIYKLSITMMMSIIHRITGVMLYCGTILIVVRLVSLSSSEQAFDLVNLFLFSPLGRLVSFFYVWCLLHHMFGGIRHLIQDLGYSLSPSSASKMSWITLLGSLSFSLLLWVFVLSLSRGGL